MKNYWLSALFNLGVAIGLTWWGTYLKTSHTTIIYILGWVLFLIGILYGGMVLFTASTRIRYGAKGYELMTKDPKEFQKIAREYFQVTSQHSNENAQKVAEKIDIGKFFYLMKYSDHYADFLRNVPDRSKAIAELFIFRAWVTQFGFRIFSSKPEVSEEIITQVFNQGKFGARLLNELEKLDIEKVFNKDYVNLIDEKWQEYDRIYITQKSVEDPIPTRQICGKLTDLCGIKDPRNSLWLITDFINHLTNIKQEAIELGLFKG